MLIFLCCMALAVAWMFPETPVGRLLRRLSIKAPARALARLTPATAIFAFMVILAIAAVVQFAKTDGLIMIAQAIPDGIAWFVTFDVATYIDVIALVWLVAATVRIRAVYQALRSGIRRWVLRNVGALRDRTVHGAGRRLPRGRRTTSPPKKEDEDWRAPAFPGDLMAA